MILKPFESISKSEIEALIDNKVREGRTIEYKKEIPTNSDENKREFLADVSSFANASGGDLIFGISEENGLPKSANGLSGNIDAEMLRLESIIRDGLDPRIQGIRIRPIEGFSNGVVLLIRIPKSWNAPHIITFKNWSRFYTRNSAGKYQMDVTEIRSAFLLSDSLTNKIKLFRDNRISKVIADDTFIPLVKGPRLILHLLPLISFTTEFLIDIRTLEDHVTSLVPIGVSGWSHRFNLDGFVTFGGNNNKESFSYCQIYRSGQVEAVAAHILTNHKEGMFLPCVSYEEKIIQAVQEYMAFLRQVEIPCPIVVVLSLTGVLGAKMGISSLYGCGEPVDRNNLILPDVLFDNYNDSDKSETAKMLRPIFDAVWNSFGYSHSNNFDENGEWKPNR